MDVLVNLTNQQLRLATNLKESIVAGTQNFVRFVFNLTEEWESLLPFAQFIQDGHAYNVYLDGKHACYLPPEIGPGKCLLLLYGSAGEVRGVTSALEFTVDENKLIADASNIEITQSLYDQLVVMVNEILDLENSDYSDLIVESIGNIMQRYLDEGKFAAISIGDGTLGREKVDSDFEATLAKADTAMQPSVYDPNGIKVDVYDYATQKATEVNNRVTTIANELGNAYDIGDGTRYTAIGDALRGGITRAVNLANSHTDAALADYSAFSVVVTDSLPPRGEERTFYLVPKASGNGYDKYWWIIDESGTPKYDTFGSSSTTIVTALPSAQDAEEDVDYILADGDDYQYYKYIDGQWALIAGSTAVILNRSGMPTGQYEAFVFGTGSPSAETATEANYTNGVYYLDTSVMNVYHIVREGESENYSYSWALLENLVAAPSTTKDYFVQDSTGLWGHFRYIGGSFKQIGSNAYSREEIDEIISNQAAGLRASISANTSSIATNTANIESLGRTVAVLRTDVDRIDGDEGYTYYNTITGEGDEPRLLTLWQVHGDTEQIASQVTLPVGGGGGGQAATTTITIEKITPTQTTITTNDKAIISFNFSSVDTEGNNWEASYVWKKDGNVLMSDDLYTGNNTFDLSEYTIVGKNTFYLTVTDEAGSVKTTWWTIYKVDIRLESSFNDQQVNPVGRSVSFTYTPYGASVEKTIYFKFNGVVDSIQTTNSGVPSSYVIPAQPHGTYLLECWATATVNDTPVETNHIYKDIIWYDSNEVAPVISCIYRSDYYGTVNIDQYNALPIVYTVFDPSTSYPVVRRYEDDVLISTETLEEATATWNYRTGVVGTHTLKLECKSTIVTIVVNVAKLNIDIAPVDANLEIDFNPVGISNTSSNRIWSNENYHMTVSNNFDWANGGYKTDANGDSYFLIKAGTTATFDYKFFGGGVDRNPSKLGAEMKIIFMIENVQDINAVWLTNVQTTETDDGQGNISTTNMGIQMSVHEGWLKTNNASDTDIVSDDDSDAVASTNTYLYMPYSEEDIIETDINIDPIVGDKAFIMAYEDGVPSKAYVYDNTDRLYQFDPKNLIIGSLGCDVRIYRLKIYSSSLQTVDIMRNFIADARNAETMIDRYNRNSIYYNNSTGTYSPYKDSESILIPERLARVIPNVKVLMLETDHFTTSKKTFVKSTLRCIHAPGGTVYPGDPFEDNWYAENGYHAGQGTTSDNYGNSGRNVDFLFNCDGIHKPSDKVNAEDGYISRITKGYGTENALTESVTDWKGDAGKVSLTRTSVPNNFFNLKVNVASSENANNALLQKRYNDFLPYLSPAKRRDNRVKNSMEFVPAVLFIRETNPNIGEHNEFQDTDWHFYALGNIGDSKKTDYTRAYYPDDMNEFTIEISDNSKINATFQSGVYLDENEELQYESFHLVKTLNKDKELVVTPVSDHPVYNHVTPVPANRVDDLLFQTGTIHVDNQTGDSQYDGDETGYLNMRIWCLYNEGFDGDHSFEPRYACCGDYRDGKLVNDTSGHGKAQVKINNDVWRAFYLWVITATDQEFVNDLDQWCVRSAVEFFYAFTHFYTMMDNRAKNTFWHFAKTGTYRAVTHPVKELLHIYCELVDDEYVPTQDASIDNSKTYYTEYAFDLWAYDMDTALGINNNGELIFPYGKEDEDFNIDGNPNSGYVFNGAVSAFWCRLRDLLPGEIATTFTNVVDDACFSSSNLINEFDKFQECYPEEIWRLDIERKYIRVFTGESVDNSIPKQDTDYLRDMMQGRKKYQRRQWVRDQEMYFGTKYLMNTVVGDQNRITFRCYKPGGDVVVPPDYSVSITPFSDMYVSAMFGNGDTQQKRAKAGETVVLSFTVGDATDTQVTIYGANRIAALNDLSACYINTINLSGANKLKKLVIGNPIEGYSNPRLTDIGFSGNTLLEEVDLRNLANLAGSLNFSDSSNLRKLYAENTKLAGVTFATNGKLQLAHLPNTINTLTMRNLNDLSNFSADLSRIETLTLEGGTLDNLALIQDVIDTLQVLYLYNIDWTLADTNLLNNMANLFHSIVTGSVTIIGQARQRELDVYNEKWGDDLIVTPQAGILAQYPYTFLNPDDSPVLDRNGNAYIQWVDQGDLPYDPITMRHEITISLDGTPAANNIDPSENASIYYLNRTSGDIYLSDGQNWAIVDKSDILLPTIPATSQYTYTFSSWLGLDVRAFGTQTVRAVYTPTVRKYTVTYYRDPATILRRITNVPYGACIDYAPSDIIIGYGEGLPDNVGYAAADYSGKYYQNMLTGYIYVSDGSAWTITNYSECYTMPTYTDGEIYGTYRVFAGWKQNTGYVTGDTDVFADWDTCSTPPPTTLEMHNMTPSQIYSVCQRGLQTKYDDGRANDGYWVDLDYIDITLGHDFNFENVESIELGKDLIPDNIDNTYGGYYFEDGHVYFSDIKLFAEDSPSFTMAIDFQFGAVNSNSTLLSTYDGGNGVNTGLRLYNLGTYSTIEWGGVSTNIGRKNNREIVVIRHQKGSQQLYIYSAGHVEQDRRLLENVVKYPVPAPTSQQTDEPLTFGAIKSFNSYRTEDTANATIYWFKIWWADLGDNNARLLAAWPHERVRMEYWGAGKYYYSGSNTPCKASWICNSEIGGLSTLGTSDDKGRCYWMNSTNVNAGGWEACAMRDFLNNRVFNGIPTVWQSLIKSVQIRATRGDRSTAYATSNDKIYLPSAIEVKLYQNDAGYSSEIGTSNAPISWLIDNLPRIKFPGVTRSYTKVYTGANEPSTIDQNEISFGTVWQKTNESSNGFIWLPQEHLRRIGVTPKYTSSSETSPGGWVRALSWWLRSPYVGHSTYLVNVGTAGTVGSTNATFALGVVPGFSI